MELELEAIPPKPEPPASRADRVPEPEPGPVAFATPVVEPAAPRAPPVRVFERAQADYEAHRVRRNHEARQAMIARAVVLARRGGLVAGALACGGVSMSASALWLMSAERAVPLGLTVGCGGLAAWLCWRWRRGLRTEAAAALAAHDAVAAHATAPGARGTPESLAADASHQAAVRLANDRLHALESHWREAQVALVGAGLGCLAMVLFVWYVLWAWPVLVQQYRVRAIELVPTLGILLPALAVVGAGLARVAVQRGQGIITCMLIWAVAACLLPWPLCAVILPGMGLVGLIFMALNTMMGLVCGWLIGQWIQVLERNAVQRTA